MVRMLHHAHRDSGSTLCGRRVRHRVSMVGMLHHAHCDSYGYQHVLL